MKKTLIFCSLAVLAFTACEQQEKTPQLGQEIRFEAPVMAPAVKSNGTAITGTAYATTNQFVVSARWSDAADVAWANASPYFDELTASHTTVESTSSWVTDPVAYWPKNGYLQFLAYHPASENANATIDGVVTFHGANDVYANYTMATDGTQKDLLYSNLVKDQTKANCVNAGGLHGIQLTFNHALANLRFLAKTDGLAAGSTVSLQSIVLKKVYYQGIGMQTALGGFAWNQAGNRTNYANIVTTPIEITDVEKDITQQTGVNDLLVMPQVFCDNSYGGDDSAEIELTYIITTNNVPQPAQVVTLRLADYTHQVPGLGNVNFVEFLPGNQYTFNITIKMDQIHFAPTITPWAEAEVTSLQL